MLEIAYLNLFFQLFNKSHHLENRKILGENRMPKIFISHACDDNNISKNIAQYLRNDGAEIWIHYTKFEVNGSLPKVLTRAIYCCDAFILVWSKQALHSRCVKLECKTAIQLKKLIIPCLFDNTKQSILIHNFQCIDFINFEQGYDRLLQILKMKGEEVETKCFSDNLNQIVKPILISSIFRNKAKKLSNDDVNQMLKTNDFFEKNRNKLGNSFNNQFELQKINHHKIIVDHASGLIWQQGGSSEPMPFNKAKIWVEELNRIKYANYHNWRLPTLEEVMSLMKKEQKKAEFFIDSIFDQTQKWIWTSDLTQNGVLVWVMFFNYGSCYINCLDHFNYVRAVCSG